MKKSVTGIRARGYRAAAEKALGNVTWTYEPSATALGITKIDGRDHHVDVVRMADKSYTVSITPKLTIEEFDREMNAGNIKLTTTVPGTEITETRALSPATPKVDNVPSPDEKPVHGVSAPKSDKTRQKAGKHGKTNKIDRNAELAEMLASGIASMRETDDYKRFLETNAMFHDYSVRNVLLIMMQCPHATKVAGYKTWQKLGRQVRKGEQGIGILAPNLCKVTDEETGEARKVMRGCRAVSVFDISQTDGEPLADLNGTVTSNVPDMDRLIMAVEHITGYVVDYLDDMAPGQDGGYDRDRKLIVLDSNLPDAQAAYVLLCEAAHIMLDGTDDAPQAVCDTKAESVAWVTARAIGLDTSEASFRYLSACIEYLDEGSLQTFLASVNTTANKLIKGISAYLKTETKSATA